MNKLPFRAKVIIKNNQELINEGRFVELYSTLNKQNYTNVAILDFYDALLSVGIDTSKDRLIVLHNLIKTVCEDAFKKEVSFLAELLNYMNFVGYTTYQVHDELLKYAEENNILLVPTEEESPYTIPDFEDYYIHKG